MDELEAWVAARGQSALWNRSVASGFFALAGKGKVTAEVVAQAIGYARDAGMTDVSAMEKLGALVVEWASDHGPVAMPAPMRAKTEPPVRAKTEPPVRAKTEPPVRAKPKPEPEPEPEQGRTFDSAVVYAALETAESGAIAAPGPGSGSGGDDAPATFESTTPMSISIRAPERKRVESQPLQKLEKEEPTLVAQGERLGGSARTTLVVGGVIVAAIVAYLSWPRGGADSPELAISHLDALDLDVDLPAGWKAAPPRTDHTALLYRGDLAHPDEQLFLAVVAPLKTDDAMLQAAKKAEDGAAAQLAATHAVYHGEGCEKSKIEGSVVCRGSANRSGDVVALNAYLRTGAERAVLAVFVVRVGDGARDDDAIVASFTP